MQFRDLDIDARVLHIYRANLEMPKQQRNTKGRKYIIYGWVGRFYDWGFDLKMRSTGWGARGKQKLMRKCEHHSENYFCKFIKSRCIIVERALTQRGDSISLWEFSPGKWTETGVSGEKATLVRSAPSSGNLPFWKRNRNYSIIWYEGNTSHTTYMYVCVCIDSLLWRNRDFGKFNFEAFK